MLKRWSVLPQQILKNVEEVLELGNEQRLEEFSGTS